MNAKWKKFEQLAYEIQSELAVDAQVVLNDHIVGMDSKRSRQIDISIRRKIGQYDILVIVECKDYKKAVNVSTIEGFVTKVRDVRANKGAIISSSGFSDTAVELARVYQIDTFRLVDTKNLNWQVYASAPALLERIYMRSFSLKFSGFQSLPLAVLQADPRITRIYQGNKLLGTIGNIIANKWNAEEIKHEPGRIQVSVGKDVSFEINGKSGTATIDADIVIVRKYYYGGVQLSTRGLKNEQTGGLVTREVIIGKNCAL